MASARLCTGSEVKYAQNIEPQRLNRTATPADFEVAKSGKRIIEQVIRPTGLTDPRIAIRPATGQVDDLLNEIRRREELAGLPAKELVPHGYGRLDTIRRQALFIPDLLDWVGIVFIRTRCTVPVHHLASSAQYQLRHLRRVPKSFRCARSF
jgi:hypothetical protein